MPHRRDSKRSRFACRDLNSTQSFALFPLTRRIAMRKLQSWQNASSHLSSLSEESVITPISIHYSRRRHPIIVLLSRKVHITIPRLDTEHDASVRGHEDLIFLPQYGRQLTQLVLMRSHNCRRTCTMNAQHARNHKFFISSLLFFIVADFSCRQTAQPAFLQTYQRYLRSILAGGCKVET